MSLTAPLSPYWQMADFSRTIEDGFFVLDSERIGVLADEQRNDAVRLRRELAELFVGTVRRLRDEHSTSSPSIPDDVTNQLVMQWSRERVLDELKNLAGALEQFSRTLDYHQVELLEEIARVTDERTSVSMRLFMRK
jgi:hypothetical protein